MQNIHLSSRSTAARRRRVIRRCGSRRLGNFTLPSLRETRENKSMRKASLGSRGS